MGVASATPFLSIATAAFLLGSYQIILIALRSVYYSIGHLVRGKPAMAAQGLEWQFLLVTGCGIFLGGILFPMFTPLVKLYAGQIPYIYAIICGMILGGIGYAFYEQRGGNLLGFIAFISGIAASIIMVLASLAPLSASWLNLFLMGGLAVVANLVPAIPTEFMDRLLGQYSFITYYWEQGYWPILAVCGAGFLTVITFLAFVITQSLSKSGGFAMSLFMGLLAGLIIQIWPLKFMTSHRDTAMMMMGICFLVGCTISSLMHKHQQRTLG